MGARNQFSEFMYAFAVTHEIMRLRSWWERRVPFIPSLIAEGTLGYDVRFDLPGTFLHIQYKLGQFRERLRLVGDELTDCSAKDDLRDLAYAGIWQFWTDAHQHRMLESLAKTFPLTYYMAPAFEEQDELHLLFQNQSVLQSSIPVRLDQFPGSRSDNGDRHRVIMPVSAPSRVFICSQIKAAQLADLNADITASASAWTDERSLGSKLRELWKILPGSKRQHQAMLNFALRHPETYSIPDASKSIRSLDGSSAGEASVSGDVPWSGRIAVSRNEEDYVDQRRLKAMLLVAGSVLMRHGSQLLIQQPSDAALNT